MSKSITQDMAYRQSLMKYAEKYGVSRASRKYNKSRSYIYFWKQRWDGSVASLACQSRRPHSHPNQHTEAELKLIETKCRELGVNVALSEVWGKGGEGGVELAKEVIRLCEQPNDFTFSYELNCSIKEKIEAIAKKIYHADGVNFTANAEKQIKTLTELGYDHMPICMAKTQYSFTDDQTKLGAPRDFTITVRNVKVSAGAGFLVALTGEIMTMPGLPKVPAAERIDVDETGKISGLF